VKNGGAAKTVQRTKPFLSYFSLYRLSARFSPAAKSAIMRVKGVIIMRISVAFALLCSCAVPLAGCNDPEATPQAESAAAKRTIDKTNAIQKQSEQNVKDGNAVLDGK